MDAVSDAPGANDDGSGTALVVELARVMAHRPYDATLVFLATAGEEQGLYGAALHAAAAREQGWEVRGVLSNDIVGDPTAPSGAVYAGAVRVFSEAVPEEPGAEELARLRTLSAWNDSPSRQLARFVHQVARWHRLPVEPRLVLRTDRFLRGGDHTAFNRHGFPAVRFTEVEEDYDRQHQDVRREGGVQYGDLPEFVDASYLAEVARVNAAALAHLANAPSAPQQVRILIRGLGHETRLRWEPSPEPDLAGYEVVWRDTASALWEHARDVGAVTEATLPVSKDNFFFGVRAYDRDGYRSPVTFAAAGRE
jgi:Zn-dependent M28 family amino/carboxypeptidase